MLHIYVAGHAVGQHGWHCILFLSYIFTDLSQPSEHVPICFSGLLTHAHPRRLPPRGIFFPSPQAMFVARGGAGSGRGRTRRSFKSFGRPAPATPGKSSVLSTVICSNLSPDRLRGKSGRGPDVRVHEIRRARQEARKKRCRQIGRTL